MSTILQKLWNEATSLRRLVIIVMTLFGLCALLIALLVRPAWRVVQAAPANLSALDTKVLTMRMQAAQLRTAPAVAPVAIPSPASAERELASPGTTVTEVRDAAGEGQATTTVNFKEVESTRLAAWLAKPEMQIQMLRLSLTRNPATGRATGSAVFRTSS